MDFKELTSGKITDSWYEETEDVFFEINGSIIEEGV